MTCEHKNTKDVPLHMGRKKSVDNRICEDCGNVEEIVYHATKEDLVILKKHNENKNK